MWKITPIIFALLGLLWSPVAGRGEGISRHVLALYDSGLGQSPKENHIHANAEVILNHLGCIVDYWDLSDGFPSSDTMQKYRGVLTWFYDEARDNPEAYLNWAAKQAAAGKKFVILGYIGAFENRKTGEPVDLALINRFSQKVGFVVSDEYATGDITKIKLVYKDPDMVEFERTLDHELQIYEKITARPPSHVYLKLKRTDLPDSESDLVFTTPNGGYAAAKYVLYQHPVTFNNQWRIDPFKFFTEAFALDGLPMPDVTTRNGLRIWTSHIDGDALISRSEVKPNTYCGEIIRDEILRAYRWPVSVSVVVGEVQTAPKFLDMARSIYNIDWVEPASHSYAHPFYWEDDYAHKDRYEQRYLPIAGYTFSVSQEIIGSVQYINEKLLPPGKKVKQFFWTGNCQPTAEALRLCEQIGIANINGGDTRFDNLHPSYTSVAPLSVMVGGRRQFYAPDANENIYTDEWEGPHYGFKYTLETFRNTESPIRIKPIDVYYHYYSGEKWSSLHALKTVLQNTMSWDVAPMFTSEYIAIVQGFFSAAIEKISPASWKISDYSACTTIRFDHETRFPDLKRSINVLGFTHYQGALYVHLDNQTEAIIVLTDTEPNHPYLAKASHRIQNWVAGDATISFTTSGWGKGTFVIGKLNDNSRFKVRVDGENQIIKSDSNGNLTFTHPMAGRPVKISINRIK